MVWLQEFIKRIRIAYNRIARESKSGADFFFLWTSQHEECAPLGENTYWYDTNSGTGSTA